MVLFETNKAITLIIKSAADVPMAMTVAPATLSAVPVHGKGKGQGQGKISRLKEQRDDGVGFYTWNAPVLTQH
jgi:hypothetical protein